MMQKKRRWHENFAKWKKRFDLLNFSLLRVVKCIFPKVRKMKEKMGNKGKKSSSSSSKSQKSKPAVDESALSQKPKAVVEVDLFSSPSASGSKAK